MTTTATSTSQTSAGILPIFFVAALGLGIVFVTGIAHSRSLHDAAHDVRHATGFPCH